MQTAVFAEGTPLGMSLGERDGPSLGCFVTKVTAGSAAARQNVQVHALLVEVNGKSTTGLGVDEVVGLIKAVQGEKRLSFVYSPLEA